jgi:hypothetical protein
MIMTWLPAEQVFRGRAKSHSTFYNHISEVTYYHTEQANTMQDEMPGGGHHPRGWLSQIMRGRPQNISRSQKASTPCRSPSSYQHMADGQLNNPHYGSRPFAEVLNFLLFCFSKGYNPFQKDF